MAAFLNIEGAFYNIGTKAKIESLSKLNVPKFLVDLIVNVIKRDTPKGGVLSQTLRFCRKRLTES